MHKKIRVLNVTFLFGNVHNILLLTIICLLNTKFIVQNLLLPPFKPGNMCIKRLKKSVRAKRRPFYSAPSLKNGFDLLKRLIHLYVFYTRIIRESTNKNRKYTIILSLCSFEALWVRPIFQTVQNRLFGRAQITILGRNRPLILIKLLSMTNKSKTMSVSASILQLTTSYSCLGFFFFFFFNYKLLLLTTSYN